MAESIRDAGSPAATSAGAGSLDPLALSVPVLATDWKWRNIVVEGLEIRDVRPR